MIYRRIASASNLSHEDIFLDQNFSKVGVDESRGILKVRGIVESSLKSRGIEGF
jgi:hypothetical protein